MQIEYDSLLSKELDYMTIKWLVKYLTYN